MCTCHDHTLLKHVAKTHYGTVLRIELLKVGLRFQEDGA